LNPWHGLAVSCRGAPLAHPTPDRLGLRARRRCRTYEQPWEGSRYCRTETRVPALSEEPVLGATVGCTLPDFTSSAAWQTTTFCRNIQIALSARPGDIGKTGLSRLTRSKLVPRDAPIAPGWNRSSAGCWRLFANPTGAPTTSRERHPCYVSASHYSRLAVRDRSAGARPG
jgi:hypothetical protein